MTVRTIETFVIPRVKEDLLPTDEAALPCGREVLDRLMSNCPVVLVDPESTQYSLPFNDADHDALPEDNRYKLHQVSPIHVRSFELATPEVPRRWTDEYGHSYSSLSIKGINFSKPGVMEHPVSHAGVVAFGLQESTVVGRAIRASAVLRRLGITTEHIIGLAEPCQYPWPLIDSQTDAHELVSGSEYKRRIVDEYWRQLPAVERTTDKLLELHTIFQGLTFIISLRAADSPHRLIDLSRDQNRRSIFAAVNKLGLPESVAPYDIDANDDLQRFLKEYWTPRAACNVALLHGAGLAHKFLHGGNVTALGSLVDLDSVHGTGLGMGDDPITFEDRAADVRDVLLALHSVVPNQGGSVTAAVDFIERYLQTATANMSASDAQAYVERISWNLINIRPNYDDNHGQVTYMAEVNTWLLNAYIRDYCDPGQLNNLSDTHLAEAAHELLQSNDMLAKLVGNTDEDLQDFVNDLIVEIATDISEWDAVGKLHNVADAIYGDAQLYDVATALMAVKIRSAFMSAVGEIVYRRERPGGTVVDRVTDEGYRMQLLVWLALQRDGAMREYAPVVAGKLLMTLRPKISELMNQDVPSSLVNDYGTFLAPVGDCSLTRFTNEVPLEEAKKALLDGGVGMSEEAMIVRPQHGDVLITYSQPGARFLEILTDVAIEAISEGKFDHAGGVLIESKPLPTYYLVHEALPDGTKQWRLLRSAQVELHVDEQQYLIVTNGQDAVTNFEADRV